jgi:hypothetical protein
VDCSDSTATLKSTAIAEADYLCPPLTLFTTNAVLPDGTIKTRNTGISFEIDKSVFLEWALEEKRDDLTRVTYSPDMRAIKNAVVVDTGMVIDPVSGEVIPGLTPVPDRISVSIDIDYDAIDLEGIEGEEDVF